MSRFWSPVVHTLSPYVPGEQPKMDDLVKLNTNENPYPPSPRVAGGDRRGDGPPAPLSRSGRDRAARGDRGALRRGARGGVRRQRLGRGAGPYLPGAAEARRAAAVSRHHLQLLSGLLRASTASATRRCRSMPRCGSQIADYRRPCSAILLPNPNAPTGIALAARRDRGAAGRASGPAGGGRRGLCRLRRRERRAAGGAPRQPAGRADPVQVARAGRPARRLRHRPAAADRGAGAGEGQLQFLSARSPRAWPARSPRSRTRHGSRRRAGASSRAAKRWSAISAALGFEVLPSQANFVFARHPRPSRRSARRRAARAAASWCGISASPASRTSCASPSERTSNATA